ncbi:MAG: response regulator [Rhodospirillales bacterium]|nr:response regulator [Rhodospirillales bacterium]
METIFEQAEERLIKLVEHASPETNHNCCIHIKAATLDHRYFTQLPTIITQWIGHDDHGAILVCHDRDIFVFSKNITFKVFVKFRDRFYAQFKNAGARGAGLVSFYDVTINGTGLRELAEHKRERKLILRKEEEEKKRLQNQEKKKEAILNAPLNQELVKTLVQRRRDRQKTEVLVVEDDPFSRKLVANSLGNSYDILFAEDGQSAIATYLRTAPDVVFLDIELPDINGHDILRKVLSVDPEAYIVMLSGNGNLENVMKAVNTGAKGFVAKPFAKEKLLQHIRKCPKNTLEKIGA